MPSLTQSATSTQYTAFRQYEPSEAACIIFIVVFFFLLDGHIVQAIRAKISYTWPLIIATAMEVVGYSLREYVIHNRHEKTANIVSQVLVIMAPACLAANLYMFVGRAIVYVGPGYAIMRPGWITPVFVGLDLLAILTQGAGSAIIFGNDTDVDKLQKGRSVLILGLFIQLIAFSIFLIIALVFDRRTTRALHKHVAFLRPFLNAFYISGMLILIRSIYRAVEFISIDFTQLPVNNYLFNTEWPYYVLDAVPLTLSILVYNIYYPSKYLPRSKEEKLVSKHEDESASMYSTIPRPQAEV